MPISSGHFSHISSRVGNDQHSEDVLKQEVTSLCQRVSRLEQLLLPETSLLAQQEAMFTAVTKIRQCLDLDRILQTTTTEVQQLLHADRVAVFYFTPDTEISRSKAPRS